MLQIHLLGKTKIEYDGNEIENQLSTKTIALICLLLIKMDKQMSREKIIGYLWPDSAEEAARYNLRYNLWLIKKAIPLSPSGESFIVTEKDCCSINGSYPFFCDLIRLRAYKPAQAQSIDELMEIRQLFRGDVLEGWYLKNCGEFNDTILFERMLLENKQMEVLGRLAELYQRDGKFSEALLILKEMASIEPENEGLALNIMQAYVNAGNRAGAINYYKTFESTLWSSLGISPEEDLKKMYQMLVQKEPADLPSQSTLQNGQADRSNHLDTKGNTGTEGNTAGSVFLKTSCLQGISFFWVSQAIEQILKKFPRECLKKFPKEYWQDLSYIQREVSVYFPDVLLQQVPEVRVVNAFCKLMSHITEKYTVSVEITNSSQIDDASKQVIFYLRTLCLTNLELKENN